jgi:hypothetical protein
MLTCISHVKGSLCRLEAKLLKLPDDDVIYVDKSVCIANRNCGNLFLRLVLLPLDLEAEALLLRA